jgi:hypothetical protein
MNPRLGVRIAITVLIVILLTIVALGIHWTSTHQGPAAARASLVVLGLSGLFGVVALVAIWWPDRARQGS